MRLRTWIAGGAALLAVGVLLVLLIDSDDETPEGAQRDTVAGESASPTGNDSPPTPPTSGTASETLDERAATQSVDNLNKRMNRALKAGVAPLQTDVRAGIEAAQGIKAMTGICELMTEAARDETIAYVKESTGFADVDWTCEKAVAILIRRAKVSSGRRGLAVGEIVNVNIVGDRGTATLDYGDGRPLGSIPVVKEDGDWKIALRPSSSR